MRSFHPNSRTPAPLKWLQNIGKIQMLNNLKKFEASFVNLTSCRAISELESAKIFQNSFKETMESCAQYGFKLFEDISPKLEEFFSKASKAKLKSMKIKLDPLSECDVLEVYGFLNVPKDLVEAIIETELEDKVNPKIEIYAESGTRFIGTIQEAIQIVFKESLLTSSWDRRTRVSRYSNKLNKEVDSSDESYFSSYSGEEKEANKETSLEKLINRETMKKGKFVLILYENEDKSNEICLGKIVSLRIPVGKKWKIVNNIEVENQEARIIVQHLMEFEKNRFKLDSSFSGFLGIEHVHGAIDGEWIVLDTETQYLKILDSEYNKIKEICKNKRAYLYKESNSTRNKKK